jgi:hypothetical protein
MKMLAHECRSSCKVIGVSLAAVHVFVARIASARSSNGRVSVRPKTSPLRRRCLSKCAAK